jgi:hypothetical protein
LRSERVSKVVEKAIEVVYDIEAFLIEAYEAERKSRRRKLPGQGFL